MSWREYILAEASEVSWWPTRYLFHERPVSCGITSCSAREGFHVHVLCDAAIQYSEIGREMSCALFSSAGEAALFCALTMSNAKCSKERRSGELAMLCMAVLLVAPAPRVRGSIFMNLRPGMPAPLGAVPGLSDDSNSDFKPEDRPERFSGLERTLSPAATRAKARCAA